MKFSLLIPTRKRPNQLEKLIESVIQNTANMNDVELQIAVDKDDNLTLDKIIHLQKQYSSYNLHFHIRGRSNALVNAYYNWMALNFCIGEYLMILNDDVIFSPSSKNWDEIVYNKLEEFLKDKPDRLVLGVCDDCDEDKTLHEDYLVTGFPIISKEGVRALGFILDPCFISDTSDDDICKLYATIGRVVDLRNEFIIVHHPPGSRALDKSYMSTHRKDVKNDTIYEEFIPIPYLPKTVEEMRFFLDKRILILLNYILESQKKGYGISMEYNFLQKVLGLSNIPCFSLNDMFKEAMKYLKFDGLFIECGVFRGDSALPLLRSYREIAPFTNKDDKILYGFDSFLGLEEDLTPMNAKGCTQLPDYENYVVNFPPNLNIVQGKVQDTLIPFLKQHPNESIMFINLDMTYTPTKYVLKTLVQHNLLKSGSIITIMQAIRPEKQGLIYDGNYLAFKEVMDEFNIAYKYIACSDCHFAVLIEKT